MKILNGITGALAILVVCTISVGAQTRQSENSVFDVSLSTHGVIIEAGIAGEYTMSFPIFSDKELKDPRATMEDGGVKLVYPGGTTAIATLSDNTLRVDFAGLPSGETVGIADTYLSYGLTQGGEWAFDETSGKFPVEKASQGKVCSVNSRTFTLIHTTGQGFKATGELTHQEIQDNREWNWTIFVWRYHVVLRADEGKASYEVTFTPAGSDAPKVLVDRFGQWVRSDFPTKVKTEAELVADRESDKIYYGLLNPPERDAYGGLLGSREKYGLEATGFFRLDKIDGTDVLVTPLGNLFFHLGVCAILPIDEYTLVKGRESIYEYIPFDDPKYATAFMNDDRSVVSFHLINYIRKTGKPWDSVSYFEDWIYRLRKWGFNSAGAWGGEVSGVNEKEHFGHVEFLPVGGMMGIPGLGSIWDPFEPEAAAKLDRNFARDLEPLADDPTIIGFFFNNEPHIENLTRILPGLDGRFYAKHKFVERLKAKYVTIADFNDAWESDFADFDRLIDTQLQARTSSAAEDVNSFFRLFMRNYYDLINTAFRKYAPHHLLIGERLMPGTANNQILIEEQGRVLDIISLNYYTHGIDKDYLRRLHKWSGGRPMILSEFYYSSEEQSLLASHGQVSSDLARGLGYRNYVEQAASLGFIVGIEWFIANDQAPTGRHFQGFNGEAGNTGLVNVADRPYKEMLGEMMKTNYEIYDVLLGERVPYVYDDPRFTGQKGGARETVSAPRLTGRFVLDAVREEWPGVPASIIGKEDLVAGASAEGFDATFHAAWDDDNLYIFANVSDPTPMNNNHKGENIWSGDGVEIFVGYDHIDEGGALKYSDRQVLLRAAEPFDEGASHISGGLVTKPVQLMVRPFVNGLGYSLEAAIPFADLGFTPREGQTILFDIAIDDSSDGVHRSRQSVWNGTALNSRDRTPWGLLKLIP
jgi:hypothetical protein